MNCRSTGTASDRDTEDDVDVLCRLSSCSNNRKYLSNTTDLNAMFSEYERIFLDSTATSLSSGDARDLLALESLRILTTLNPKLDIMDASMKDFSEIPFVLPILNVNDKKRVEVLESINALYVDNASAKPSEQPIESENDEG